jgi:pyruvate,orthophosphate dikinase
VVREGDVMTLDGGDGTVMRARCRRFSPTHWPDLHELMGWVDSVRRLKVYTNADTPRDCQVARDFGAEGIGLCRTEHMFFDDEGIMAIREMILADDEHGRRRALEKLLPMQRATSAGIFKVMDGLPVIIRLLDPPLHEFLPHTEREIAALAAELGVDAEELDARNRALHETNPMLGHRGCRLGLTFPEIYEMQVRAILEAAVDAVRKDGVTVNPMIMIPLVGHVRELSFLREVVDATAARVLEEGKVEVPYKVGTMIELPRACLTRRRDRHRGRLLQLRHQRPDADHLRLQPRRLPEVPAALRRRRHLADRSVRVAGSGRLRAGAHGDREGPRVKPHLSIGICGEHGGEPRSVAFCPPSAWTTCPAHRSACRSRGSPPDRRPSRSEA